MTDEQEEPVRVQHGDGRRRGLFEQFVVAVERATLLQVGVELGLRGVCVGQQRPDGLFAKHEVVGVAGQRVAVDHFAAPRADAGAEIVGFGFGGSTVLVNIEDAVHHKGEAAVRVVDRVDQRVTALDGTTRHAVDDLAGGGVGTHANDLNHGLGTRGLAVVGDGDGFCRVEDLEPHAQNQPVVFTAVDVDAARFGLGFHDLTVDQQFGGGGTKPGGGKLAFVIPVALGKHLVFLTNAIDVFLQTATLGAVVLLEGVAGIFQTLDGAVDVLAVRVGLGPVGLDIFADSNQGLLMFVFERVDFVTQGFDGGVLFGHAIDQRFVVRRQGSKLVFHAAFDFQDGAALEPKVGADALLVGGGGADQTLEGVDLARELGDDRLVVHLGRVVAGCLFNHTRANGRHEVRLGRLGLLAGFLFLRINIDHQHQGGDECECEHNVRDNEPDIASATNSHGRILQIDASGIPKRWSSVSDWARSVKG